MCRPPDGGDWSATLLGNGNGPEDAAISFAPVADVTCGNISFEDGSDLLQIEASNDG